MIINFDKIESTLNADKLKFSNADPFPHLVIENFLFEDKYHELIKVLPPPGEKSNDYLFAKNKFENPKFDLNSKFLTQFREELCGQRFENYLSSLYGEKIFIDGSFVGGGLHQGGSGSFLDMHADFNRHPVKKEWVRELNILLYLNEGYIDSWGGELKLHNSLNNKVSLVAPKGNRLVIMLTKDFTLHGYNKIQFPFGRYRTSIAAYAYKVDNDFIAVPERTTLWHPDDPSFFKGLIAKHWVSIVRIKHFLFGSNTAKRADRKTD